MPAPYADILSDAMSAVDDVFGERLRIEPRLRSGKSERPGPDETRPATTITGVLRMESAMVERGNFIGRRWEGEMEADKAEVFIQHANMPAYDLRDGDRITALDRVGAPMFEVNRIDQGHAGRMILQVTPL